MWKPANPKRIAIISLALVAVISIGIAFYIGTVNQKETEKALQSDLASSDVGSVETIHDLEALDQAASDEGISISDKDIEATLSTYKSSFGSSERFAQMLKDRGVTEDALRKKLKANLELAALAERLVPKDSITGTQSLVCTIALNATMIHQLHPLSQKILYVPMARRAHIVIAMTILLRIGTQLGSMLLSGKKLLFWLGA